MGDKSKWIALSFTNEILAEHKDPIKLVNIMKDNTVHYTLQWIGDPDITYIF